MLLNTSVTGKHRRAAWRSRRKPRRWWLLVRVPCMERRRRPVDQ